MADIANGIIAEWPCQDVAASTAIVGFSGASNSTLGGGDDTSTPGKSVTGPGGSNPLALALNGSDDFIDLGNTFGPTNNQAGSFSIYVKFNQSSGIIADADASANRGFIKVNDTTIRVVNGPGTNFDFTVPSIGTSAFRLLTLTRDTSNQAHLYMDGVESSTGPQTIPQQILLGFVGKSFDGTSFLDGAVADIRTYNRELSAADIQAIVAYNTTYSGAITFVGQSSADAAGTTSVAPNYPAGGLAAGDWISYFIANKYATTHSPGTITGFTQLAQILGGSGLSTGPDNGETYATLFSKDTVSGSESGNMPTCTMSPSATNSALAKGHAFRRTTGGTTWGVATATGQDNTIGVLYSVTFGSDPGIQAGDCIVIYTAINGAGTTHLFTLPTLTIPGCTISSSLKLTDAGSNTGDDVGYRVHRFQVSAGTSSGAATFIARENFGSNAAGGSILVRLREVTSGPSVAAILAAHRMIFGE